jgi:hypothetical protein
MGLAVGKANIDERWLRVANGVTHCFLSNSKEILLDVLWQALFGHTGRMKVTSQAAGDI